MSTRRSLLRGAAALALAAAVIGSGALAPVASAAPLDKPGVDGSPKIPGIGDDTGHRHGPRRRHGSGPGDVGESRA